MKVCANCSQYHNQTQNNTQKCYTYEKYTYLLKDEFLKWSKEQSKQSKNTEKSKVHQHHYIQKPNLHQNITKGSESKVFQQSQRFNSSSKTKPYPLNNCGVINKRIEKVINKSKKCKQHRNCNHLKSTQIEDMHYSSIQQFDNSKQFYKQSESIDEHETAITLSVMPCERLFQKPFNSKLLCNPVIYDSLKDNRICGIQFCDEGEVEVTNEKIIQLFAKWKAY